MVYFDHNATAPMLPCAREAWLEAAEKFVGNPSSPHRVGSRAEAALNAARETIADCLGCDALDLVWTSGATEANNMVAHHLHQVLGPEEEVWISAVEHPCLLEAVKWYFPKRHRLIPVQKPGAIDLAWLETHLARRPPGLTAVMAANNETGVLQPWREAARLCRQQGVPFMCDAAQWLGRLPAAGLGECDWVSGCAHKFGGPKGVGFLKCPGQGAVTPLLRGGKQEQGRRAGTENVPSAMAMATALRFREEQLKEGQQAAREAAKRKFEEAILAALPGSEIAGEASARLWNTVSALMPEADCQQRWVVKLDKLGFAVSTGSACASGQEEPSHVLTAMGYTRQQTSRALRFSGGWETSAADWGNLLEALRDVNGKASG